VTGGSRNTPPAQALRQVPVRTKPPGLTHSRHERPLAERRWRTGEQHRTATSGVSPRAVAVRVSVALIHAPVPQTTDMPEEFVVARNPEPNSSLPYLLRIPLGRDGIVLKARETWPRTSKQARPHVTLPTARASRVERLEVVVDTHERYAWRFTAQQVDVRKAPLTAGDYGVLLDGELLASVERKSLPDLCPR